MRTSLVLTVIADDKPGLVESIADCILAFDGANWEESRMVRLAGKFAGLLRVSVDAAHADALERRLEALGGGLTIAVERAPEPAHIALRPLQLDLIGADRPGIVRDIARVLARHGVNIEELETDVSSAPMSGEPLFRASTLLHIPAAVSVADLRRQLEDLAAELMVDLTLDAPVPDVDPAPSRSTRS